MDAFFGGDKKSDTTTTTTTEPSGGAHHPKPSTGELLASAKLVGESAFGKNSENVDKAKVAGAAEDLLNAAEDYGNLGEKGYGKYVDKAEDYLHKYHDATGHDPPKAGEAAPPVAGKEAKSGEKEEGGGGMGDAMKMAGGLFK